MRGLFIPEITAEMFRNGCLESIEALMAEGEIYDIEYSRWIPVSERLPEKNDVYLVAVNSWGCPTRDVDGFMAHTDRKWEVYGNKVIAWMPLPEPYTAEGSEE